VEHGRPNGPFNGGWAMVRRPGDGERWQWPKVRSGEGVADSDKKREGLERLWWSEARPVHSFIGSGGWGDGWMEAAVGCH
jgi:hypothetical protein